MLSLRSLLCVSALLLSATCFAATVQFNARQDIATGFQNLSGYAVADFNGDGKPDLAFTDSSDKRVVVYLNNGSGGFAAPLSTYLSIPNTVGDLAVGDVNEDGRQDLIVATISGPQPSYILLGKGDGTFTQSGTLPNSNGFTAGKLVDLNGDKHLDFLAASEIWLGDGKGNFSKQPLLKLNGSDLYTSVVVADLNGDGKQDIVESSYHDNNAPANEGDIEVLAGNGDGTFKSPVTLRPYGTTTYDFLGLADFNGDGKLDLAFSASAAAAIALGNGDGTFQTSSSQLILPPHSAAGNQFPQPYPPRVLVADFDGDGKPDVAISNPTEQNLLISLNDGTGKFTQSKADFVAGLQQDTYFLLAADLNGDGLPDIIGGSYTTNSVEIFLSKAPKTTPSVTLMAAAAQVTPGTSVTVSTKVTGTTGTPTGTVTFSEGTTSLGQATLDATGQASISVSNLAVGQHSLTATYSGDSKFNGTSSAAVVVSVVDFAVTLATSTQTVTAGSSATYSLTVTGTAGLTGTVTLSCTGLPSAYACAGTTVALGAQPATATLTVSPTMHAALRPGDAPFVSTSSFVLAFLPMCVCLALPRSRRTARAGLLCVGALLACGGFVGCGGSSSTSTTYRGTSTFTINATTTVGSQTLSHQTTATLTVQ